jgi:putative glutathione S-transferase
VTAGAFVRQESRFRGRPEGGPDRHHLYIALACPWSQRTAIVRAVLGLEDDLSISYADPYRDERGWAFTGGRFTDELNGFGFLVQAYRATDPDYDGRVSVPVLWDKEEEVIVSNESADIVRILNEWAGGDLYPPDKRAEIDELNGWIYSELQNGVYRAGFARSQEAYDEAFRGVFAALERLERHLRERVYLTGETMTRGRLAPAAHAAALRRRLPHALPLQRQAADRVPEPDPLHDRPLPPAARRGDVRARRDQAPLLHDPRRAQPEADHPRRPARPGLHYRLKLRSISRLSSRSLIVRRLSPTSLPRAKAISTFAWRSLK